MINENIGKRSTTLKFLGEESSPEQYGDPEQTTLAKNKFRQSDKLKNYFKSQDYSNQNDFTANL